MSAIIVMIQGQRSILGSSKGIYDFYQTKQVRSVTSFFRVILRWCYFGGLGLNSFWHDID